MNNSGFLKNLLFTLILFLGLLLGVETVFSRTHLFGAKTFWSRSDPLLGYRYVPGSSYWYNWENNHPITGKINRFGWRDKERSLAKDPSVYRIAVLGDSFVEAFQVEQDRTFLALAEQKLNKLNLPVELLNFGCSGCAQAEEFLILQNETQKFSPDRVILFFHPESDIQDISKETALRPLRPFYTLSPEGELLLDNSFSKTLKYDLVTLTRFLNRHSALFAFLSERYKALEFSERMKQILKPQAKAAAEISSQKTEGPLSLCTKHPDPVYVKNYQLTKALMKAMAAYCKERKIPFLLVCIDTAFMNPPADENFFEEDLRKYALKLGIEYIGLQKIVRRSYDEKKTPLHFGGHWNYEGHRVVADLLAKKLKGVLHHEKLF